VFVFAFVLRCVCSALIAGLSKVNKLMGSRSRGASEEHDEAPAPAPARPPPPATHPSSSSSSRCNSSSSGGDSGGDSGGGIKININASSSSSSGGGGKGGRISPPSPQQEEEEEQEQEQEQDSQELSDLPEGRGRAPVAEEGRGSPLPAVLLPPKTPPRIKPTRSDDHEHDADEESFSVQKPALPGNATPPNLSI
jgi:hypothetical protein